VRNRLKILSFEEVKRIFEKQIRYRDSSLGYDYSLRDALQKELFELTADLTLNDWLKIRGEKYWKQKDQIKDEIESLNFTINQIKYYLQNGNRNK
jgi:cobalamin biosynthesis Mg chelatase CobN